MPKKNEFLLQKCGTAIHESVESGDNVIVHTSLKSMGYVCGGAQAVIEALIETVGENGNDYDADTNRGRILTPKRAFMERVTKKIGRSSGKIGLHTTKNDADQHDGRGGGDVSTVAGECSQRSSGTLHLRMGKERGISDAKP